MRSWRADDLWRDFLRFCGARPPDETLIDQFAAAVTAEMHDPVRALRAEMVTIVLRTRLVGQRR